MNVARTRSWLAWALHNAVAHPLMVVLPSRWGTWLHDATADLMARQGEAVTEQMSSILTIAYLHGSVTVPPFAPETTLIALEQLVAEGKLLAEPSRYTCAPRPTP